MFLQSVKISHKVLFVIGLALLTFITFAFVAISMGNKQLHTLDEIYSEKVVPLDNLRKIQLNLREIEYRMAAVVADMVAPIGSGEHLKMATAQIDTQWLDVKKRINNEALKKEIADFEKGYAGFKDLVPQAAGGIFQRGQEKSRRPW